MMISMFFHRQSQRPCSATGQDSVSLQDPYCDGLQYEREAFLWRWRGWGLVSLLRVIRFSDEKEGDSNFKTGKSKFTSSRGGARLSRCIGEVNDRFLLICTQ